MRVIRILHISDLHRSPDWENDVVGDYKDKAVSSSFFECISRTTEEDFLDAIDRWQTEHGTINIIACTGDLGNRGDASRIEEGMAFIKSIQKSLSIDDDHVLVCPGNHDVNRKASAENLCETYCKALANNGYIDHRNDDSPIVLDGVPFVIINSCLGATERSLFIGKFNELVEKLSDEDKRSFEKELEENGIKDMDDCLDIPAITYDQRRRVANAIRKSTTDFSIILSHHSILPYNSIEVRPYYSVIDAGKTLYDFFDTKKNILYLHGHIHFASSLVVYESRQKARQFISSIGAGLFNGKVGSTANIIEVFSSDQGGHIITKVFELTKCSCGFSLEKSYNIYEKVQNDILHVLSEVFASNQDERIPLKNLVKTCNKREKDVLITVLSRDDIFRIDMCDDEDFGNWMVYYLS